MRKNKLLLLYSSLGSLAVLAAAAYSEHFLQEWRVQQSQARALMSPDVADGFATQLRQVVVPSLRKADRCVSCHVGMAAGETGVPGNSVYGPHPKVVHDVAVFGCTVCHSGQGFATTKDDAHGEVHFWPEPMIPRKYAFAGCGACHSHLAVPESGALARGLTLFERHDCFACHRVDKKGGTLRPGGSGGSEGPDLSLVGATGFATNWHAAHMEHAKGATAGPWATAFKPVAEQDRHEIETFLASRVGAPDLIAGKALFNTLGCRGCHKVGGVGGDDGPDLTHEGQKDPALLPFAQVEGPRTLEQWFKEHFRAPATVVTGSTMPQLGLSESQIDLLTGYLFSLRKSPFPEELWPRDRLRAERLADREFASDGATLYGTFCAACHGPSGEGMRYPGMTAFPAVANRDFLAVASDSFMAATIQKGRVGRRMAAWGPGGGGLQNTDIDKLVGHLRHLGGGVAAEADTKPPHWVRGDTGRGRALFASACASCHGAAGEGGEGPALANPNLLETATDTYLFETVRRGRSGTSMLGFEKGSTTQRALSPGEMEDIVTFIRTWGRKS